MENTAFFIIVRISYYIMHPPLRLPPALLPNGVLRLVKSSMFRLEEVFYVLISSFSP